MVVDFFDILLLEACGTIEVQLETGRDYQDVVETRSVNQICLLPFISRGLVSASWSSSLWHREESGVDSQQKFLSRGD